MRNNNDFVVVPQQRLSAFPRDRKEVTTPFVLTTDAISNLHDKTMEVLGKKKV